MSDQILTKFTQGALSSGRSHRVYIDGGVLYSYGRHFPLAVRLLPSPTRDGTTQHDWMFVVNGDRYSRATAAHQRDAQRCLTPHVTIAASAFPFDVMHALSEGAARLVAWSPDEWAETALGERPAGLGWSSGRPWESGGKWRRSWHRAGAAVIRLHHQVGWRLADVPDVPRPMDFFCSRDEGGYFCAMLPKRVDSVDAAYLALTPPDVRRAGGPVGVLRQGEWFFLPMPDLKPRRARGRIVGLKKHVNLGGLFQDARGNAHVARDVLVRGKRIYVRGTVRHRTWWGRPSGQHRTVNLREVWHRALRNTELASWSANGRVD